MLLSCHVLREFQFTIPPLAALPPPRQSLVSALSFGAKGLSFPDNRLSGRIFMASTTLSSWALLVWEELQQRELGAREIFVAAGLDPARLQDPNARFPVPGMQRLWQLAEERS